MSTRVDATLRHSEVMGSVLVMRTERGISDLARLLPAPSDPIGPAQKAALKELVDDLVAAAQERGVRLGQGRNDYPAVWGALKQRFDVAKYDELSMDRYDEALAWLKTWIDRVRAS